MARAFPAAAPSDYSASPGGEWQALRGELVALLDQVEGQYARGAEASEPAVAGFAQRMRDLRYQMADIGPDDRHREALRSVKRQIERFTDRDPEQGDNVLQAAIQQIRARTGAAPRGPAGEAPAASAHFEQLARAMGGLSDRLGQLETELKAQRGNAAQVREIADQVSQLSHVVELLAGAVGETGQVKRLESQIAGLAQLVGQAPKVDLTQINERLDSVAATVDRLADLQVQQVQHLVREAEEPKGQETAEAMRAIEGSVRTIYDRLDALESSFAVPPAELERISGALALITSRLGNENARPERLLALVDALNGRINELELRSEALGGLKDDIASLRSTVVESMAPRFGAIETRLEAIGEQMEARFGTVGETVQPLLQRMEERLGTVEDAMAPRFAAIATQLDTIGERIAVDRGSDAPAGVAQLEAQVRQLVARMDQTSEQLAELARLYTAPAPTAEPAAPPDFEALAQLAADRSVEALAQRQPEAPQAPDYDALAELAAAKAGEVFAQQGRDVRPTVSEHSLAQFEARMTRLLEGLAKARAPEGSPAMQAGLERVEDRLARLEESLKARAAADPVAPAQPAAAAAPQLPPAPPYAEPADDAMPRNPAADAPLREFGFPDLGPVRAALEAKNGPRLRATGAETDAGFETMPITPEMAGGVPPREKTPGDTLPPSFDPASVARPPKPESSLDAELAAAAAAVPAEAPVETAAANRNTFIEAARRAAQRQNAPAGDAGSLIGKAFSRLQPGTGGKPAGKGTAEMPVAPARPEPAPMPAKTPRRGLFARKSSPAGAVAAPPPAASASDPAAPTLRRDDAPATPVKESFLVRHRRAILLGASLVAISFMTLNLVMQRLSGEHPAATANTVDVSPAAGNSRGGAPATATPPAQPDKAAAKPVSEITPSAPSQEPIVAGGGTRSNDIPTDPVTTASINPGPAMSFAPVTGADPMPAPLAAASAVAAPTASPPPAVALAALPKDTTEPVSDAAAPPGAPDAAAASSPAALESPVKVEMPPAAVGPQDLRQAAADGDARAQFEIAAIYSEGRAVPQDFKQAEIWYERAAAQGFGPAQYRLGNLYENGKGVTKDLEQARLWYQRAAEAGNRMAMHNLAALYAGGQFGKQDFASAAEWFERAADLGMKDSQFNLGMLYARGLGVPQNLETSYKWFALAATGGDSEAGKARDDVARSLDAAALKRAQAAVAAWKVQPVNLAANFAPLGTWEKNFNPGPAVANKDVVMKVQVALMRLGFDVGTPDGHMGPKTEVAIKSFEEGTGMSQVGQINPRLLAVLGSQPV